MLSFYFYLFSLFPLKFMLSIQNFRVVLVLIETSTLVWILLIFNFCSLSFCKILICFQFYYSILICDMLFFQFDPHSFNYFLVLLLNWFIFIISPFNKKNCSCFIIYFYFNLVLHCCNWYFFFILDSFVYLIFFFTISSFNIWLIRNRTL